MRIRLFDYNFLISYCQIQFTTRREGSEQIKFESSSVFSVFKRVTPCSSVRKTVVESLMGTGGKEHFNGYSASTLRPEHREPL